MTWTNTNKSVAIKSTLLKIICKFLLTSWTLNSWRHEELRGKKKPLAKENNIKAQKDLHLTPRVSIFIEFSNSYLWHSGVREGTSTSWRQIYFLSNALYKWKNLINKQTKNYKHISYTCKKVNTMTKYLRRACETNSEIYY